MSKDEYKACCDGLKDIGFNMELPQQQRVAWDNGKTGLPEPTKLVLKKASQACVKTIDQCRDMFKELKACPKGDTETGGALQNRLRKEWDALGAAKILIDDMITYEATPEGRKLDYNSAISEMNKIGAVLESAFDAIAVTKVHLGLNAKAAD